MLRGPVPGFAQLLALLNIHLRKGRLTKFAPLDEENLAAKNALKKALISPSVLIISKFVGTMALDTDTGDTQVGCLLLTSPVDKTAQFDDYSSRILRNAEKRYDTAERQRLNLLWCVLILCS